MKRSNEITTGSLVNSWFGIWDKGNLGDLPIADGFTHISPYGTIDGKSAYMDLVNANRSKFLGNKFEIHDLIIDGYVAAVRYTMTSVELELDVSEWIFCSENAILKVVSYYNIGGAIEPKDQILEYDT